VSLFLILAACVGGAAATYLFDDDAPLPARLAIGGPLGLAVFGLVGFVAASLLGLGPAAVVVGLLAAGAPLLTFADPGRRRQLNADARAVFARPGRAGLATIFFYVCTAVLVWQVTERAALFEGGAIGTGVDHNLGDLPFHLAIISSFAYGQNLPPEHPELAGVRLTYPFLVDFIAAMIVRAGGSLRSALFLEGLVLGLCIVALLHRWALLLTHDRIAALVSPVLFLLNGGLGWTLLFGDVKPRDGLMALLSSLPHNYTILPTGELRWGNVVTTLLVPQRTLLLGLPLALAVATLWWQALEPGPTADEVRARRRMTGAGVIAGLLPLVHGHSFAVVMSAGACLALLFPRRTWAWFFAPAAALALPQVLWMAAGSALRAGSFVGWHVGWDHGEQNVVVFWLRNAGLLIPLLVAAFVWRRRGGGSLVPGRLARFYVPFALCFVVPNLLQLSPWIWDNIKFLVYWLAASTPIVALLLAHWWRRAGAWRGAVVPALALLTLAGGLDVWRVVSRAETHGIFDADAVSFAQRLREATPPRALVLHTPTYRSPVFLAGRRSLLGYPGHIWSQGLDAGTREADIAAMYRGGPDAPELIRRHRVDYVMYGPEEAAVAGEEGLRGLSLVLSTGRYRLYAVLPAEK
jgi:hypothetical protein